MSYPVSEKWNKEIQKHWLSQKSQTELKDNQIWTYDPMDTCEQSISYDPSFWCVFWKCWLANLCLTALVLQRLSFFCFCLSSWRPRLSQLIRIKQKRKAAFATCMNYMFSQSGCAGAHAQLKRAKNMIYSQSSNAHVQAN